MADNVKFIFKTLFRIPIIVFIVYFVFNIFAFSFTYFRLLGFSYVALQTAVENNYIPETEYNSLTAYLGKLSETEMLENAALIVTTADTGTNQRVQYGSKVTVRVQAEYKFIWPLMPNEQQTTGVAVTGLSGENTGVLERDLEDKRKRQENIVIEYTVPGLKYYPDLS